MEAPRERQRDRYDEEEGTPPTEAPAAAAQVAEHEPSVTLAHGTASGGGGGGDGPPAEDDGVAMAGIRLDGILRAIEYVEAKHGMIDDETTTGDLCKARIQPATAPGDWICEPRLIEVDEDGNDVSDNGWYWHEYIHTSTAERRKCVAWPPQDKPPPGTRSMCELLAADPATAHFVGTPTHFFSHAHKFKVLNSIAAMKRFVSELPPGEAEKVFWWFDIFSVDQVNAHRTPSCSGPPLPFTLCRARSVSDAVLSFSRCRSMSASTTRRLRAQKCGRRSSCRPLARLAPPS
eukprot:COSAG06_NODE_1595_length_8979_cov_126.558784_5_plen_290_part_00